MVDVLGYVSGRRCVNIDGLGHGSGWHCGKADGLGCVSGRRWMRLTVWVVFQGSAAG